MDIRLKHLISAVIFSFFLSACVLQYPAVNSDKKQQAAKARIELALSYLYQNQFELAKLNLDKALGHDANYYLVYSAFAYFYQRQGEVEKARQAYLTSIKLDAKQGDVHNNFGVFLCSQQEYEKAFEHFYLALSASNYYSQADTYENIALCAFAVKQLDIFRQALQSLQKLDAQRAQKLEQVLK
ncbi:type IV pilus biogenesis/stability protein PilW [Rodentibacter caecimuris]|uniref:Type IV pilus biogenesis/stability protein PilW n=1 Tax=Rodentibacter caecimuris TaxID=1796644 RepID=A0ABX3L0E2_9PAST|nr:type IV pilus biogenesis/stability protein PilW [Rodentibacter heylii]